MSTDAQLEAGLGAIRALSDTLIAAIATFSAVELNTPSNCPPWAVRDLVVHLVIGGAGFVSSVRRGLAGSVEPAGNEERLRRQTELETATPAALADALNAVTTEFVGLYDGDAGPASVTRWPSRVTLRRAGSSRSIPIGCRRRAVLRRPI